MIGDIILIEPTHEKKAELIVPKIKKRNIVLIYGGSGTGKTEISQCVCNKLYKKGMKSFIISLDDYYETYWGERIKVRKRKGIKYVGLKEINWEMIQKIVKNFRRKEVIKFWRIHKYADTLEHSKISSKKIDVLIIEGLYAGYIKKYRMGSLGVYLEGSIKQTYPFRKKRKKENPDNKFRQLVIKKENKIVSQLKLYANIVIPFELEK